MHTTSLIAIVILGFVATASSQVVPGFGQGCSFECDRKDIDFVCGSDGLTYDNQCDLMISNCDADGKIGVTVDYKGKCGGSSDGCKNNCEGLPVNYVCGGDGTTYANVCQMKYEGCQSGIVTNVAYGGKCKA